MAGASSRRGKADRKNKQPGSNNPPPGQGRAPADPTPANNPTPAQRGQPGPATAPSAGPASGRGRQPDVAASAAGQSVRSGSRDPSASRAATATEATPKDGVRERQGVFNRNVDFAGNAYNLVAEMPTTLMGRPKFNKSGKPAKIDVNSHRIQAYPTKTVYQYDVVIGSGAEKRGLIKSVWESKILLGNLGKGFIFDGNKIGWSLTNFKEDLSLLIDLDQERGIPPREGRTPNQHRVVIRKTSVVNLAALEAYLEGKMSFGSPILEAINFLDHLLRETPSKAHISQRRSYFGRQNPDRMLLGGGVEAMKGVYQSIRAAEGRRLVVNVDVSNTVFWHETVVSQLALLMTHCDDMYGLEQECIPVRVEPDGDPRITKESAIFHFLKRLHKNEVCIKFRGAGDNIMNKVFKIAKLSQYTARDYKFDLVNKKDGTTQKDCSVEEYFRKRYDIQLEWPLLPLLETNKKGVLYPMECCHMLKGQKYPFKLDEVQTAKMIKFAVSRPSERREAIEKGLHMLDWKNDPFLANYGLKIDPNMLSTEARILNPPEVAYKGAIAKPGFSGRWDLRGKTFLTNNGANGLISWGVVVMGKAGPQGYINQFVKQFISVYRGHGGTVQTTDPVTLQGGFDAATAMTNVFTAVGNRHKLRPQLLLVVLPTKDAFMYNRVKKSCDCRYGVVSQCIQFNHMMKNVPQYHSNICMKINAKLGGTTCRVALKGNNPSPFPVPTLIIGADVSHAAPGSNAASFAAITMSMDKMACRYAAAVETNGVRVELIASKNMQEMIEPLLQHWQENVGEGRLPKHVYYFRDGVSEGQYQQVLQQEVADIRQIINKKGQFDPTHNTKFTVVVAEKRHHIRFFPPRGPAADKNGNPLPGTLVERDVTHPFEYDFYLCSHAAIQGTARPTHYHMLMDECNLPGDQFQTMLYEHSYQYQRATTPVSLFPAVYYAHLASNRARSHLDISEAQIRLERSGKHSSSQQPELEIKRLIPMTNQGGIRWTMWYI